MAGYSRVSFRGLLVALFGCLMGCNQEPQVVEVSGIVTHNGKAIPGLTVHFVPESGRPSWGLTDENGHFTLEYDNKLKGALVGTHTVWVQWRARTPQEEMNPKLAGRPAAAAQIQDKYGSQEKSPLKINIERRVSDLEVKLD
jgi:hypothetical protein